MRPTPVDQSWTAVADGVAVTTSRLDRATSTIVSAAGRAVLIDPNWTDDELDDLARRLRARELTVTAGIATHAHHDHLLWHPDFGDAPRYAAPASCANAVRHRTELIDALGDSRAEVVELMGRVTPLPGPRLDWAGPALEFVVHDGHSEGHTAVWLPGPRVLLAGDMLSDTEIPLLEETGADAYADALELLRPYAERAAVVVPGHGRPGVDGAARWHADADYLTALRTGVEPDDPRLAAPEMAAAHLRNQQRQAVS